MTRDDGVTQLITATMFEDDKNPLRMIFYDPKDVDVIFSIAFHESTAEVDADGTIIGYDETIPVIIRTIRKQGISEDKAWWKCEAELRRIIEVNPLGSYRSYRRGAPSYRDMGGWFLLEGTTYLTYGRDTT
jgi:hypothetical protein